MASLSLLGLGHHLTHPSFSLCSRIIGSKFSGITQRRRRPPLPCVTNCVPASSSPPRRSVLRITTTLSPALLHSIAASAPGLLCITRGKSYSYRREARFSDNSRTFNQVYNRTGDWKKRTFHLIFSVGLTWKPALLWIYDVGVRLRMREERENKGGVCGSLFSDPRERRRERGERGRGNLGKIATKTTIESLRGADRQTTQKKAQCLETTTLTPSTSVSDTVCVCINGAFFGGGKGAVDLRSRLSSEKKVSI